MSDSDAAGESDGLSPAQHVFLLENLPWYVNGTLEPEAAATIATWSSRLPAVRRLVDEERRLAQCLAQRIELLPLAPGAAALQARLVGARTAGPGPDAAGVDAGRAGRRAPAVDHARVRWAVAAMALLCLLPITQPWHLLDGAPTEASAMRGLPPAGVTVLRVRFRDAASGAEITRALRAGHAEVVAGPDAFGDFRVRALAGSVDALRLALLRSGTAVQAEPEGGNAR